MTADSIPRPAARAGFLPNANVFCACFFLSAPIAAPMFAMALNLTSMALPGTGANPMVSLALPYALLAAVFTAVWLRVGLSPAFRKPGRERRFRIGQGVLLLSNAIAVTAVALPFAGAYLTDNSNWMHLMWLWVIALPLCAILSIAGLYMVWSSAA